jgi:DNA invertase Pin-like site-specific DNA recombinase
MTQQATIYARFSNAEQAQGNSKARQLNLCREMVAQQDWLHSPDRELVDEGLSAFSGANRAPGGLLYEFEQQAEAGRYRGGHVLVVENLDRISRQGYEAILPFIQKLTAAGVTVATVDGGRIYPAFTRVDLAAVIEAVVKSELAWSESDKKSRRLKAAQNKRVSEAQATAGQHLSQTATVPAWIAVNRVGKAGERPLYKMTLNEERVAILHEIFQLTIDGYGTPAIAKKLNERGEPVWSHLNQRSNNGWTVGYLTKIVMNRAVMGEYRPMNKPRGGQVTSKGVVIPSHFPQAIDPVVFARAQAARASRRGTSGAWQISHNNLFSGLAKCGHCGGRMKQEVTVRAGGNRRNGKNPDAVYRSKQDISYLKCHNALNRVHDEERGEARCTNRYAIRYEKLEAAVLDLALHFAAAQGSDHDSALANDLEVQVAEAMRHLEEKQSRASTLADSYSRTASPAIERLLLALEAEIEGEHKAIGVLNHRLQDERSNRPAPDHFQQVEAVRERLENQDAEARAAGRVSIKQTLRSVITRMVCMENRTTAVTIRSGVEVWFDNEGNQISDRYTANVLFTGPNGEIDWNPDEPDADYQYVKEAR